MKLLSMLRICFILTCSTGIGSLSAALSARRIRAHGRSANVHFQKQDIERQQTLAEDRQFWGMVANTTETTLKQLEKFADLPYGHFASLQVSTRQVPESTEVGLGPMAGMLDDMYEECKKRIVQLNQREATSKQRYEERSKLHDQRIASVEAEFRNHQHVPAAMLANESALKAHIEDEDNFIMKYWDRVRKRNHKQYHTFLKIQHGLMDKLKSMRDQYQQAAQGSVTTPKESPEVAAALLQHRKLEQKDKEISTVLTNFVKDSLSELNSRRQELKEWD